MCEVLNSEISELANARIHGESCERIFDIFKEEALDFLYSEELCKHYPDIVVKLAKQTWYYQEPDYDGFYSGHLDIEKNFGLADVHNSLYPPSGLQGPFSNLLQHNAEKGIAFIIELLNYATLAYTKSDLDGETTQVGVHLNDGRTIQQWGGQRLWCLYRGTSVAPNILQSALMALENWLFRQIESDNDVIEIFNKLLFESNNVAITGMLVSIATAYPKVFKKHALPLLRTREFYSWDTQRLVLEQSAMSSEESILRLLTHSEHKIHDNERKTSAQKQHRGRYLENLAMDLQITEVKSQIFDIFDTFRSQLPPPDDQSEEDKTWRIVLSRIDLRRYNAQLDTESQHIILNPQELEQDLQQFQEQGHPEFEGKMKLRRLLFWGMAQYKKESNNSNCFANWQEALQEAQEAQSIIQQHADDESYQIFSGGYAYIAAVIARDHWAETSDGQKEWCRQVLLEAIAHKFNSLDSLDEVSIFEMAGSRPAATALPLLLGEFDEQGEEEIRMGIAASHLHPSREVRWFAVRGCHDTLWEKDPVFAENCLKKLF